MEDVCKTFEWIEEEFKKGWRLLGCPQFDPSPYPLTHDFLHHEEGDARIDGEFRAAGAYLYELLGLPESRRVHRVEGLQCAIQMFDLTEPLDTMPLLVEDPNAYMSDEDRAYIRSVLLGAKIQEKVMPLALAHTCLGFVRAARRYGGHALAAAVAEHYGHITNMAEGGWVGWRLTIRLEGAQLGELSNFVYEYKGPDGRGWVRHYTSSMVL
ncbi:hypothetical protein EBT31_03975 [bacterium]|nr:hypothetical protein [bacterium]